MDLSGTALFLLGIDLIIGVVVGFFLRKKLIEGNQADINAQGRLIIENALHEAEQSKKETLLQTKEAVYQSKKEAEKEIKDSRQSVKEEQRRLDRKFDKLHEEQNELNSRESRIKSREGQLTGREKQVDQRSAEVDDLIEKQRYKLEKIAGIGRDVAKKVRLAWMRPSV